MAVLVTAAAFALWQPPDEFAFLYELDPIEHRTGRFGAPLDAQGQIQRLFLYIPSRYDALKAALAQELTPSRGWTSSRAAGPESLLIYRNGSGTSVWVGAFKFRSRPSAAVGIQREESWLEMQLRRGRAFLRIG